MSRQLKRQLSRANGGRGPTAPSDRPPRTQLPARTRLSPQKRLNRILLIGGGALAVGAVVLSLMAPHFDPRTLAVNLTAIAVGLVMGKGIGRFMFRRLLPGGESRDASKS